MPEVLEAKDLVVGYPHDPDILDKVSISLSDDEIVTVLGANGAGKSTLLKTLIGLVPLRAGTITLFSRPVSGLPPSERVRRGLGYVPQSDNVFKSLSVEENLEIGLKPRPDIPLRGRRDEIYGYWPLLANRRRQLAGSLSGGERQMLALARALMPAPKVMLLDEPTAGLSPHLAERIFEQIRDINRSGVAVLMVEQHAAAALKLSHRGYLLRDRASENVNPAWAESNLTNL